MAFQPVENYGVIGNIKSIALVDRMPAVAIWSPSQRRQTRINNPAEITSPLHVMPA
jgi:hypothetical protein